MLSVIVPAYNAGKHLDSALDCIQRQRLPSTEVIVVDDGSSDGTAAIAAKHSIGAKIIRRPNGGPAAARNTGLQEARGELIAFLDVDDQWPDGSLSRRIDALHAHAGSQMIMGRVRFEGLDGVELPVRSWAAPNLGAGLFRREVFRLVGAFEEGMMLDDIDWFWRARDAGIVTVKLDDITLHYRRHPESLTAFKTWVDLGLAKVIRRALHRREPGRAGAPLTDLIDVSAPR